jgi:hypothetical protein
MAEQAKDLWPDDFGTMDTPSPGPLLREQAAQLGRRTNNVVEAEVEIKVETDFLGTDRLVHRFYLKAPLLSYHYLLFTVMHEVAEEYPVEIVHDNLGGSCDSHNTLVERLKEIFSSASTKKIIATLVRESRA